MKEIETRAAAVYYTLRGVQPHAALLLGLSGFRTKGSSIGLLQAALGVTLTPAVADSTQLDTRLNKKTDLPFYRRLFRENERAESHEVRRLSRFLQWC